MCVFFASFLAVILLSENGDGTSLGSILLLLLLVFNKDIPDLKKKWHNFYFEIGGRGKLEFG